MSDTSQTRQSRLSDSHTRPGLPGRKSLLDEVSLLKPVFEREQLAQEHDAEQLREQRRESFMVKRQRPNPELKPSRDLAAGPDRDAFNQQWAQEQEAARAHQLQAATHRRDELAGFAARLDQAEQRLQTIEREAQTGNIEEAQREAFKLERSVNEDASQMNIRSQSQSR